MMALEEVLERLDAALDRAALEDYIAHAWVRPRKEDHRWQFEEIDIARVQLVHHLRRDMAMNDDAMDIVLHLLDQMYGMREQMRRLHQAIGRQPEQVQEELRVLLREMGEDMNI